MNVWIKSLVLLFIPIYFTAQTHFQREVEKLVKHETNIQFMGSEGCLVIAYDNGYIQKCGLGYFERLNLDSMMYHVSFPLGGVTKTFLAEAIRAKIEDSTLARGDSWKKIVGPDSLENLPDFSIQELLHHATGLPRIPNNFGTIDGEENEEQTYTWKDLREFLSTFKPQVKKHYLYSHLNYVILGKVYEHLYHPSLSEWKDSICNSSLSTETLSIDTINGHDRAGLTTKYRPCGTYTPAMGLCATPAQMISWLVHQLEGRSDPSKHKESTPFHKRIFVSDGWHILDYQRYPIYLHSGRGPGHYAYLGFVRETGTGVILLANTAKGTEDLGNLVLRMINHQWKRKGNDKKK